MSYQLLRVLTLAVSSVLSLSSCDRSQPSGDRDSGANGAYNLTIATDPKFEADTTMEKLSKAKKITIGTKFDQPLFGQKGPDNKPRGFDVAIGSLVASRLGIPYEKIEWVETVSVNREPFIQQAGWTSWWQPTRSTTNAKKSSTLQARTTRQANPSWF